MCIRDSSEINRRGTTVLMVTHEHNLVKHFHRRVVQIHDGQVVACLLYTSGRGPAGGFLRGSRRCLAGGLSRPRGAFFGVVSDFW